MACSPTGTTSNPLCPKSAGRAAVSSNVGVSKPSRSSSAIRAIGEAGRGAGRQAGGLTRLLKRN